MYRWLLRCSFEPQPPISLPSADPTWPVVCTRGGSCLKISDVFLHAAQVQQASAASLVPEQSDLTHVDSSVAQNLTSQSRKSEHLGKGEQGYTYTALCIKHQENAQEELVFALLKILIFGSFIECDFVGVTLRCFFFFLDLFCHASIPFQEKKTKNVLAFKLDEKNTG